MLNIIKKFLGTTHERSMKKIRPLVLAINELEPKIKKLSDADLKAMTSELRQKLDNGATLDDIIVEAFAAVREASIRTTGMRHYDVQLVGGIVQHQGKISEMKTGEGKTLVATLSLYLNALEGKGAHLVTVNDYLAKRDAEWMGKIYNFLGLSVGVIEHGQTQSEKKKAYQADITYGQNNEFGFDYLRDNMKFSYYDMVQRGLNYAIVDEADSILIDEARTPLIISGGSEESTELYRQVNAIIPSLRRDLHFSVDEKGHSVMLTEEGVDIVEKKLGLTNLYDASNIEYLHHIEQGLKAHTLYKRDVHYHVSEQGEIVIIDEFTGRLMPGRRWSDGLHQAVEAKEGVTVQEENKTLATISFQNLFRLYNKLAGMTGTADTEAEEFHKIYELDVVVIPPNKICIRQDHDDLIYKTYREKRNAVIDEISECYKKGQPVLVGTISVEKSEDLSRMLIKKGIPHNVLNAKHHEREAFIIAQAGRKGAVTVSTNMAGRGTDIILGGNAEMLAKSKMIEEGDPEKFEQYVQEFKKQCEKEKEEVVKAGGLHVIGTERHESRRIDNQLRGRSGRQGDPGSSRFYLSLEDDLMRIFGGEKLTMLMDRVGMEEGAPIQHPWVTKSVERAQKKVESHHFDIRKNLKEYDDVMDQQRKTVYSMRRQILEGRYKAVAITIEEKDRSEIEKEFAPIETDPVFLQRSKWIMRGIIFNFSEKTENIHQETQVLYPSFNFIKSVNIDAVIKTIYNYYGVQIENKNLTNNTEELYQKLVDEVSLSLSEQRERLFDLIDNMLGDSIQTHCGKQEGERWNVKALRDSIWKSFDLYLDLKELESKASPEELAQYIYDEIEQMVKIRDNEITHDVLPYYLYEVIEKYCNPVDDKQKWNIDGLWDELEKRIEVKIEKKDDYQNHFELYSYLWTNLLEKIRVREGTYNPLNFKQLISEKIKQYCKDIKDTSTWDIKGIIDDLNKNYKFPIKEFVLEELRDDARRNILWNIEKREVELELKKLGNLVEQYCSNEDYEQWDIETLLNAVEQYADISLNSEDYAGHSNKESLTKSIFNDIGPALEKKIMPMIEKVVFSTFSLSTPPEEWQISKLKEALSQVSDIDLEGIKIPNTIDLLGSRFLKAADKLIKARSKVLTPELYLRVFRDYYLMEIDRLWIDHLQNMEYLRQGIGLRGYAQKDPKREYQKEGFEMFQDMFGIVQNNVAEKLFHVRFSSEEDVDRVSKSKKQRKMILGRGSQGSSGGETGKTKTIKREKPKVGRNDPCPCGSGKKYKKCCMLKEQADAGS